MNRLFQSKIFVSGILILITVMILARYIWGHEFRAQQLEIFVIPLRNSQAILIRTPADQRILINGGSNSEIMRSLTKILPFYSRQIDVVVASDSDERNVTGLIGVLDRFKIGQLIILPTGLESLVSASSSNTYQILLATAKKKQIPIVDNFDVAQFAPVKMRAVFPLPIGMFDYSKTSHPQYVVSVSYGRTDALILGDASVKVQKAVAEQIGQMEILIVSMSDSAQNIWSGLASKMNVNYLIYAKSLSKSTVKSSPERGTSKITDPLYWVLSDHRYNTKKLGMTQIMSDGEKIRIRTK